MPPPRRWPGDRPTHPANGNRPTASSPSATWYHNHLWPSGARAAKNPQIPNRARRAPRAPSAAVLQHRAAPNSSPKKHTRCLAPPPPATATPPSPSSPVPPFPPHAVVNRGAQIRRRGQIILYALGELRLRSSPRGNRIYPPSACCAPPFGMPARSDEFVAMLKYQSKTRRFCPNMSHMSSQANLFN